jgi:hypothetical protein
MLFKAELESQIPLFFKSAAYHIYCPWILAFVIIKNQAKENHFSGDKADDSPKPSLILQFF